MRGWLPGTSEYGHRDRERGARQSALPPPRLPRPRGSRTRRADRLQPGTRPTDRQVPDEIRDSNLRSVGCTMLAMSTPSFILKLQRAYDHLQALIDSPAQLHPDATWWRMAY